MPGSLCFQQQSFFYLTSDFDPIRLSLDFCRGTGNCPGKSEKRGAFVILWCRFQPPDHSELIFPCSLEFNLDRKPFPIEISLLMHFLNKDFVRTTMYVCLAS